MAAEIQFDHTTAKTCYIQVRNAIGQIWNTVGAAFEAYVTANIADYDIAATEQGTASGLYAANMPAVVAGIYGIVAKERAGGAPAESDLTVAEGEIHWSGTATIPLSLIPRVTLADTVTTYTGNTPQTGDSFMRLGAPAGASVSADIAVIAADNPNRPTRGVQLDDLVFTMVDATDFNTPETGITVTAQISKDGGAFAGCSNAVSEISAGFYKITLTAAEMTANSIALKFTGTGCAQRNFAFRTQPT